MRLIQHTPEWLLFSEKKRFLGGVDDIASRRVDVFDGWAAFILENPLDSKTRRGICDIIEKMISLDKNMAQNTIQNRSSINKRVCHSCKKTRQDVENEEGGLTCISCGVVQDERHTDSYSYTHDHHGGGALDKFERQSDINRVMGYFKTCVNHYSVCESINRDGMTDIILFVLHNTVKMSKTYARLIAVAALVKAQLRWYEAEMEDKNGVIQRRTFTGIDMPLHQPMIDYDRVRKPLGKLSLNS